MNKIEESKYYIIFVHLKMLINKMQKIMKILINTQRSQK